MKQVLTWILLAVFPVLAITGCKDDKKDEPVVPTTQDLAKSIIGNWLYSASTDEDWITYEFTESSRVNAETYFKGYQGGGTGYFSISENVLSGSFIDERNKYYYLDWVVNDIKPFEISMAVYDDNTYLGDAQLYRILSTVEVEAGSTKTIDLKGVIGSNTVSGLSVLDETVAKVDHTGVIEGVSEGVTFITFMDSRGKGAIKVEVTGKIKSFSELLVGTWVYDNPKEKTWERYTFAENGYLSVQWTAEVGDIKLDESRQSTYTVDGTTVKFTINIDAGQMNMMMETESINEFNWTESAYDGTHFNGKYTLQRCMLSATMSPQETITPDYQSLVGTASIQSFKSHDEKVASVDQTGTITAISKGRTYIDVNTNQGSGVIEVVVEGGAIPVAFEECVGATAQRIHEILGDNVYYESEEIIYYKDYNDDIEMIGVQLNSFSGRSNGVTVKYKNSVNTAAVTAILDATFIPFLGPTTDTFKAYMDAETRDQATIGVTWDIPALTLTYVNLFTDLFPDYSVLIGLTSAQITEKMGRTPDSTSDSSLAFFFYDNKGIAIVGIYFGNGTQNSNKSSSVYVLFDDTLTNDSIITYLKKKYHYYPEYSSDEELIFIPSTEDMGIFYMPKDKTLMYIPFDDVSGMPAKSEMVKQLRSKAKSIKP